MVIPIGAYTVVNPLTAFFAPQTISISSVPVSTKHSCNLSASGCGLVDIIFAATKPSKISAGLYAFSTSSPISVNFLSIVSIFSSVSRCCFSQDKVNFIF